MRRRGKGDLKAASRVIASCLCLVRPCGGSALIPHLKEGNQGCNPAGIGGILRDPDQALI